MLESSTIFAYWVCNNLNTRVGICIFSICPILVRKVSYNMVTNGDLEKWYVKWCGRYLLYFNVGMYRIQTQNRLKTGIESFPQQNRYDILLVKFWLLKIGSLTQKVKQFLTLQFHLSPSSVAANMGLYRA